jgi:hypothetical protein
VAWAHNGLVAFVPEIFRRYAEPPTDPRVLAFSLVATVVCATVAGVWPGLRATSQNVATVLQREGGGRGGSGQRRGSFALLATEALIASLLVAGAALTARSLVGLMQTDVGFETEGLHSVGVFFQKLPQDPGERYALFGKALEAIRQTRDVRLAAGGDVLPIQGAAGNLFVAGNPNAYTWRVTDRYFETMGMQVLAGRPFTFDEANTGARVGVLSERGLHLVWPGVSAPEAVGRILALEGLVPAQIVGVVADVRSEPAATPNASLYLPLVPEGFGFMRFVARTAPAIT